MAAALTDAGMGGYRFEPLLVAQTACGDAGGEEQVIWVAVRAPLDERFGPPAVREARVEVFLGLRSGQGVEVGYAADDQTLTFQLDG